MNIKLNNKLINKIESAFADANKEALTTLEKKIRAEIDRIAGDTELRNKARKNNYDFYIAALYKEKNARVADELVAKIVKKEIKKHDARTLRIAGLLERHDIKDIDLTNSDVIYGTDTDIEWVVDGLLVTIRVIWAGGYNIMCLHTRVLCNVKKLKALGGA
tara:strand:- start:619 stop:1101 length:483 start_codon:yes stop_codon:yes gene_type:complete